MKRVLGVLLSLMLTGVTTIISGANSHVGAQSNIVRDKAIFMHVPAGAESWDPSSDVNDLSCPSQGNCVVVGGFNQPDGSVSGMVRVMKHGTWETPEVVPVDQRLVGAFKGMELFSVSCAAVGECVIVGTYGDVAGDWYPIGAVITGGVLHPAHLIYPNDPFPSLGYVYGRLNDVDCPEINYCVAVGERSDSAGNSVAASTTYFEGHWDTFNEASLPGGAAHGTRGTLNHVSCFSAGHCAAAGSYNDASENGRAAVMMLDGLTWSELIPMVFPEELGFESTAGFAEVSGVACPADGVCVGVGVYQDSSSLRAFQSSTTDGVNWVAASNPAFDPAGRYLAWPDWVDDLVCVEVGECVSTGSYAVAGDTYIGYAQVMSSGIWGAPHLFVSPGSSTNAHGVSCVSAGNCVLSGSNGQWLDSTAWTATMRNGIWTAPVVTPFSPSDLHPILRSSTTTEIACTSMSFCVAGGQAVDAGGWFVAFTQTTHPRPSKPSAPEGLSAVAGSNQVLLRWLDPLSDGGADVTAFRVQISTTGKKWRMLKKKTSSPALEFAATNLLADTTYFFRIAAINKAGVGVFTRAMQVRTLR